MKKICLFFSILTLLVLASAVSHAAVVDKIVVVVNNEIITQSEIDRALLPIYQQYKSKFSGSQLIKNLDDARQTIVGQLIEEKLVLGEAKKQNTEVGEKEIDAKIDEARKRFPSPGLFEEALAAQRVSLKELREKYKEQLMTRKLIDQKIGSKVFLTPTEINDYYNKHIEEFSKPEELKLSNILVKNKASVNTQKTLDLVNEISKRLKAGDDFAELAKIYSEGPGAEDGGVMGYVRKGDLLPEIEKVVFGMKEGEISGVIKTDLGYHFFKVEEKKDAGHLSLSEVRRFIEDKLWTERIREKSKGWVEDLRKHAYIAFK